LSNGSSQPHNGSGRVEMRSARSTTESKRSV
jgi:hypothetical protein